LKGFSLEGVMAHKKRSKVQTGGRNPQEIVSKKVGRETKWEEKVNQLHKKKKEYSP